MFDDFELEDIDSVFPDDEVEEAEQTEVENEETEVNGEEAEISDEDSGESFSDDIDFQDDFVDQESDEAEIGESDVEDAEDAEISSEDNFEMSDDTFTEVEDDDAVEVEVDEDDAVEVDEDDAVDVDTSYADNDGTVIDAQSLLEEDEATETDRYISQINNGNDFIGDTNTQVVVTSGKEDNDTFKVIYVDIPNIAVTKRIRTDTNVDDLQKSIRETGLLEPLTVAMTQQDGVYVLLDGYRRLIACAKLHKNKVPCVVNKNINVPDIPIIEALYNKSRVYTIPEMVEYINYLEKDKGIMNPQLIEYLLPLNPGDYNKLKDILADNDEDIVDKLYSGVYNIETAFKKLEQKRKKMSASEKENKKAEQASENGADIEKLNNQGETAGLDEDGLLTDEQVENLHANASSLDEGLDNQTVEEMDAEANNIDDSFKPHQQKVGEREYIDPNLKKSVLVRDGYRCWCCKTGGEAFVDVLDFHHIVPVSLGGKDTKENAVMLCLTCHRMVHLYQTRDLYLPAAKSEDEINAMTEDERAIYNAERDRYKRIIKLGTVIREGMHQRGMNREQYKKANPIGNIGRNKPGQGQERT